MNDGKLKLATNKLLREMTKEEIQQLCVETAEKVKSKLPDDTGFVLLVVPIVPNEGFKGPGHYIGNLPSPIAAAAMLDQLEKWAAAEGVATTSKPVTQG